MTSSLYQPRDDEPGPLAGLLVLDLTIARAGPTCARQLADMGADVVQVGSPHRGDLIGSDGHNLHRGKRSLLLDLKTGAGREAFLRFVDRADVLVENFRAGVKHRLQIDYDTLAARNPRLVYASVSGFGQEGPYAGRPGLDQIAQGLGGLMSVTGQPGSGPWRTGIAISDTASGTFLTQGVLGALLVRERTGRGQWVHTSLLEAMVNFMDFQATRWLIDGEVPQQAGNDHPTIVPMGTYRTADGYINIAAVMGWPRFVDAIDDARLGEDPRFATGEGRARHNSELRELLDGILSGRSTSEWVRIFSEADLPCGPVLSLDEVFTDPQAQHLHLTRRVEHERDGEVELLRHPVTLSETPTAVRAAAPVAGTHTRELLAEVGYSQTEVEALLDSGAAALQRPERGLGQ